MNGVFDILCFFFVYLLLGHLLNYLFLLVFKSRLTRIKRYWNPNFLVLTYLLVRTWSWTLTSFSHNTCHSLSYHSTFKNTSFAWTFSVPIWLLCWNYFIITSPIETAFSFGSASKTNIFFITFLIINRLIRVVFGGPRYIAF